MHPKGDKEAFCSHVRYIRDMGHQGFRRKSLLTVYSKITMYQENKAKLYTTHKLAKTPRYLISLFFFMYFTNSLVMRYFAFFCCVLLYLSVFCFVLLLCLACFLQHLLLCLQKNSKTIQRS